MAKILFFNIPAYGHINPTLPLITELIARGQTVICFNSETLAPIVQGTGAEFCAYPNSSTSEALFAKQAHNLVQVSVFILEESLRLLPFALAQIAQEKPDLVIFDSIALWGMQAARLKKVASVSSFSTFVLEGVQGMLQWRDYLHIVGQALTKMIPMQSHRRELVKRYGPDIFPDKSIFPCRGDFNLVYTSRAFQPATAYVDSSFHFYGPSILAATRQAVDFPWALLDPERPKIYLSLGTLYNNHPAFYRMVLTTFADYPAQFILSVGRQIDIQTLGEIPPHFIVQATVPQLELLPKVDLFITHGGMNSVNEGLNAAVPLVVVPQQLEQVLNGRQVAQQGAGVVLADKPPYGKVSGRALREAVDKVLADPSYRHQAQRLRHSFAEAGGYQQAVTDLLAWLGSRSA